MNANLKEMLLRHEGIRYFPYVDSVGKLTIGVGRNLDDVGITKAEAEMLLENDAAIAKNAVRSIFMNYDNFSEARQNALTDLMFNIGKPRFLGFKKMISAIRQEYWDLAAREMLDSKWAKQVPTRAAELAKMVSKGA